MNKNTISKSVQKDFQEVIQHLNALNRTTEKILHHIKKDTDTPPPLPREVVWKEIEYEITNLYDKASYLESFVIAPETKIAQNISRLCDLLNELR